MMKNNLFLSIYAEFSKISPGQTARSSRPLLRNAGYEDFTHLGELLNQYEGPKFRPSACDFGSGGETGFRHHLLPGKTTSA